MARLDHSSGGGARLIDRDICGDAYVRLLVK